MDHKLQKIKVSVFRNVYDSTPKEISILRWLDGFETLNPLVDAVRAEPDDKKRGVIKKKLLPAITPSGIFQGGHNKEDLLIHSGLIALDFDNIEYTTEAKLMLGEIQNVIYAGLSASGAGVWALIPIKYPEHHNRHFEALKRDFGTIGLKVDANCKDVCRLRYYSYDNEPFFNPDAITYEKLAPEPRPMHPEVAGGKVREFLRQAKGKGINVFDAAVWYVENEAHIEGRKGLRFEKNYRHWYFLNLSRVLQIAGVPISDTVKFIHTNFIDIAEIQSNCITFPYEAKDLDLTQYIQNN